MKLVTVVPLPLISKCSVVRHFRSDCSIRVFKQSTVYSINNYYGLEFFHYLHMHPMYSDNRETILIWTIRHLASVGTIYTVPIIVIHHLVIIIS